MSRTFHVAADIRTALQFKDRELGGLFRDTQTKRAVPAMEAREKLIEALRAGFDVIPPCEHVDERGNCLGHEKGAAGG